MRTAHHHVRTLRTHSSLGIAEQPPPPQQRRKMAQPPLKPARKFPPIFENTRGNHYGSNGYFGETLRDEAGMFRAGDLDSPFMGAAGSSPNLGGFPAPKPRNRNSCVSLGKYIDLFCDGRGKADKEMAGLFSGN